MGIVALDLFEFLCLTSIESLFDFMWKYYVLVIVSGCLLSRCHVQLNHRSVLGSFLKGAKQGVGEAELAAAKSVIENHSLERHLLGSSKLLNFEAVQRGSSREFSTLFLPLFGIVSPSFRRRLF